MVIEQTDVKLVQASRPREVLLQKELGLLPHSLPDRCLVPREEKVEPAARVRWRVELPGQSRDLGLCTEVDVEMDLFDLGVR
jgi:hypothetical protein